MKTILTTFLIGCGLAHGETIVERVDFTSSNRETEVMVSFDVLAIADLFKPKSEVRHMEFESESMLNFAQNDPDAETIARLLERYGEQDSSTHWSRNHAKYKTAAVVAAIGTAVAYIVAESKESSGRDISVTAGGDASVNTGVAGGNVGTTSTGAQTAEFEGIE